MSENCAYGQRSLARNTTKRGEPPPQVPGVAKSKSVSSVASSPNVVPAGMVLNSKLPKAEAPVVVAVAPHCSPFGPGHRQADRAAGAVGAGVIRAGTIASVATLHADAILAVRGGPAALVVAGAAGHRRGAGADFAGLAFTVVIAQVLQVRAARPLTDPDGPTRSRVIGWAVTNRLLFFLLARGIVGAQANGGEDRGPQRRSNEGATREYPRKVPNQTVERAWIHNDPFSSLGELSLGPSQRVP